ncbi:CYFA0S01e12090g1_1 [Cyberlindnera fabianii]|uniref:CYFA0S01e12090g1_1 n=1 Tax=Cyberlindnera fabianii TaxID=36022 RepID=A0A061AJ03_CYBFA|nr:CYFA0S01e12090g1_1 [Cyberlindnera fabianii]
MQAGLTPQENAEENTHPEDYDHIDYTAAFLREDRRRQVSQEILRRANVPKDSLDWHTGFVDDAEYRDFGDGNDEVYFDVLPSFEMHRAVHDSSYFRGQSTEEPPEYSQEATPSIARLATSSTSNDQTSSTDADASEPASLAATLSSHRSSIATASTDYSSISDQDIPSESIGLDDPTNVHKLPRMAVSPKLTVQVNVTKSAPRIGQKQEMESMLKEYTSGDLIHGYVVIENATDREIPFHMFYVTLQGHVSIVDSESKKLYNRRFLHMIDLNASWSFGCISPSCNVQYKYGDKDWDDCYLGLPPNRVLAPQTKYKKFFTFKVPYKLLDNTCRHGQELHTLLPPSLGVNRYFKNGKYSQIQINDALGYGHSGRRGSPILTRDMSNDKTINYSINASLIAFHPTLKDRSGQPMPAVMCDEDYAVRFIPFGFGVSLFSSNKAISRLKQQVQGSIKNAQRKLMLSIEGNEDAVAQLDNEIKLQQLTLAHGENVTRHDLAFPLRNQSHSDISRVDIKHLYVPQASKSLFGKKKSLTSNEAGWITITTHVPKDGLPYVSPSLLRKTNDVSELNALGLANYEMMNNSLSPDEKKKLTSLDFDFSFLPSDMASMKMTSPPEISQIVCKLVVGNVSSTSSIPVKMWSDFFICDNEKFEKMRREFADFDAELAKIKAEFDARELHIERYIDRSIFEDVKAMKELKSDVSVHPVFKTTLSEKNSQTWSRGEDGSWSRHVKVHLEFHDLIRETLVPNFQSCLLSRIYCIQTEFKFRNSQKIAMVRVPIRLRWFD